MFFNQIRASAKPIASLSGFALFSRASSTKPGTGRFLIRQPSPLASREVPTPLVFLSATTWDKTAPTADGAGGWTDWSAMYASRGYTCIEIDLNPPDVLPGTSEELMEHFTSELNQQIRLAANPFPPVLFARAFSSLIAQNYISSHPVSAMFLLAPPTPSVSDTTSPAAYEPREGILPTALPEFNYEARFPIGVMYPAAGIPMSDFEEEHRLAQDQGGWVEHLRFRGNIDGSDSESGRLEVEKWMDRVGI
ncbi:hypothetical protein [Phaffia rhodozyma]|uniref:Uncharacterized protein n=1 Tax=Phaffia rhodozyma TaxID=264483 RepID=A0A0F7SNR4_PHARH|nr:hypothetical protein [Phaffia rhodozyma]